MRRVVMVAAAGVVVLVWTLLQLTAGGERQTGSNRLAPKQFSVTVPARKGTCQPETLFAKTARLRMTIATFGADRKRLDVRVLDGNRQLAAGHLDPGWQEGVVDVPISPVPKRSTENVTLCVQEANAKGKLTFGGEGERASVVSYAAGRPSLLDVAGDIAARYGHGSARWLGGWALWFVLLFALAGVGFAGLALLRPRARYPVAAILAIGAAWALLIPPFMVPDELAHFAYVQGMVETGSLPTDNPATAEGSPRLMDTLGGLDFYNVIGDATSKPPWTAGQEKALRTAEHLGRSRASHDAGSASANPPLYYAAEAPVYALTRGASPITALLPMRLLSVLLGGLTVFCVFAFLRELMPRRPIAWSFGALAVALQPLFGFITSGVNADAGLFAASAATFWAMAALLRHGPSWRRVAGLGVALAAGLLIKPLFIGLVPAGLAALALAALLAPASWRQRIQWVGAGAAIALLPAAIYSVLGGALGNHPYFPVGVGTGIAAAAITTSTVPKGLRGELVYIWQLFAPRLPFMQDFLPGHPLRDTWFGGFVGRFGWLDYGFAKPAVDQAALVAYAVLALAASALVQARAILRTRWPMVIVLLLALVGVLGAIGSQQYRAAATGGQQFTQARYLLPLLGLYGALGAVAIHGLGRRAAPYVAIVLVALATMHEIAAMLLTVARFYA